MFEIVLPHHPSTDTPPGSAITSQYTFLAALITNTITACLAISNNASLANLELNVYTRLASLEHVVILLPQPPECWSKP